MDIFNVFEILPGSSRSIFNGEYAGRPHLEQEIEVTILLRRPKQMSPMALVQGRQFLTRRMMQFLFAADQSDLNTVIKFAAHYRLLVAEVNYAKRWVVVRGTIEQVERAFNIVLSLRYRSGQVLRVRSGPLLIPRELSGIVTGVFGLDERPQGRSHLRLSRSKLSLPLKPNAFDGNQLAGVYQFPPNQGTGETIALLELAGGYRDIDVQRYFSALGLPCPTVLSVPVSGGANNPGVGGADIEVLLDIEVAGAVAPNSKIVVYFAPNTEQGVLQAILAAVHDTENAPSIISFSWGGAESTWTQQSISAINDAFEAAASVGMSVFCAAGDSGADDAVGDGQCHVDFPSSSPWATACGGTTLVFNNNARQETVWNDSSTGDGAGGGGISDVFQPPDYQIMLSMPTNLASGRAGRGVPDVAAVADPETGYAVLVDGLWNVVGGTSAVAPLFAGLMARINSQLGRPSGFINSVLYTAASSNGFNDIVNGNNSYNGVTGYSAAVGWDAVTGWGTPNGNALLKLLSTPAADAA